MPQSKANEERKISLAVASRLKVLEKTKLLSISI